MNKNEETLKKMYEVFSRYDINENETVDEKFLEMMSDYKNFNTLMNIAFGLDTSEFVTEDVNIEDKRIVYNIKKFGPLYKNIYESYKRCFIDEDDDWNPSLKSHKDTYNSFIQWYDKQLQHMNKEELVNMLKCIITDIEEDSLTEKK